MNPTAEITLCMGSSCFARGNRRNLEALEEFLRGRGLEHRVDLRGSLCLGACAQGPNLKLEGRMHQGLDEGTVLDLVGERFAPDAGTPAP